MFRRRPGNFKYIQKASKPFLLYLLKKFDFEIEDINGYNKINRNIHICRKMLEPGKYILFQNPNHEEPFTKSEVFKRDNYSLINRSLFGFDISECGVDVEKIKAELAIHQIEHLDQVLLSNPYKLQDNEIGYGRSLEVIRRFQ